MNLEALCNEVLAITGRDDLAPQIASFIRQVTFAEHLREIYSRDLVELEHTLTTPSAHFVLNISSSPFQRFRAIHAIFPFDPAAKNLVEGQSGRGPALEPVQPNDLVDSYGQQRTNCYYLAGMNLTIRYKLKLPGVVIVYVQAPDVLGTQFSSWIADEFPYVLIHEAAAKVYTVLKNQELVKTHKAFAQEYRTIMLPFTVESAVR